MKKGLILTMLISLVISSSYAQVAYKNAVGLRLGDASGITFKHQKNSTTAIEGILHSVFYGRGLSVTALYEKNLTVFDDKNFQCFYGAGGHIGFYSSGIYQTRFGNTTYVYSTSSATLGLDAILGLEWKIPEIPFTASVDIKPTFEIYRPIGGFLQGGFSIRYTF